jgi:hypothetical protein
MTRQPPRFALALVARFVPDSEPIVGDLQEESAHGRSRLWIWWQSLAAVAAASLHPNGEIRPLRLVDEQPFDAIERTREVHRRRRDISPSASPLPGGLGLVILGGLVTAIAPVIWLGLLLTVVAGLMLAWALTAAHKRPRGITQISLRR